MIKEPYISVAWWPYPAVRLMNGDNTSEDGHGNLESARAVALRLWSHGFGGDRIIKPLRTAVKNQDGVILLDYDKDPLEHIELLDNTATLEHVGGLESILKEAFPIRKKKQPNGKLPTLTIRRLLACSLSARLRGRHRT